MQITRDMVAQKAGVSSATVSRVFNNPTSVSPELRAKVLEAASGLLYTPNKAAATLRRRGTGIIAFVEMEKMQRSYYWGSLKSFDWFFGRSLRGIQEALKLSSYQLQFQTIKDRTQLEELAQRCDGILAYDIDTTEEEVMFSNLGIPYVLSHHLDAEGSGVRIVTDNIHGGILQASYLKAKGCKKPLYITGFVDDVFPHKQRLEGFCSEYAKVVVLETAIGTPRGVDSILAEIERMVARSEIDSIAAVNDLTLFEVLLKTRLDLPSVGYDASPFYHLFPGPVASVDLQSGLIYNQACQSLLSILSGKEESSKVILPALVEL